MDIQGDEVGLLAGYLGVRDIVLVGLQYAKAVVAADAEKGLDAGGVEQPHGSLTAVDDAAPPSADLVAALGLAAGATILDAAAAALVRLRADATTRAAAVLPNLKTGLKTQVDDRAEALRLTLITPGSGQAMEYQEAYAEAVQVDAAVKANAGATVDPAAFPMLSASLGYDLDPQTKQPTVDIAGEARAVLAAYDAYQKAGAAIRNARLKGKAAIDAAADVAAAQAAFAAIVWPTLA